MPTSKAAAARALDATVESIKQALKNGEHRQLIGFGAFYVGETRCTRGPQSAGERPGIQAAKSPKFRAGKGLKDACN